MITSLHVFIACRKIMIYDEYARGNETNRNLNTHVDCKLNNMSQMSLSLLHCGTTILMDRWLIIKILNIII